MYPTALYLTIEVRLFCLRYVHVVITVEYMYKIVCIPACCCLADSSSDSMKEFISLSSSSSMNAAAMDTARVRMRRVSFIFRLLEVWIRSKSPS